MSAQHHYLDLPQNSLLDETYIEDEVRLLVVNSFEAKVAVVHTLRSSDQADVQRQLAG